MRWLAVLVVLALSGCSTVNITYNILGDNNSIKTDGQVVSPKEISTAGSAYGDALTKGE